MKQTPTEPKEPEQPSEPELHEPSEPELHEPPSPKKPALEALFGDVFVTTVDNPKSIHQRVDEEILKYKNLPNAPLQSSPLEWWKKNANMCPLVARLPKIVLAVPATSVPSERVFSTTGDIVTAQRSTLVGDNVDKLIFLKKNLQ